MGCGAGAGAAFGGELFGEVHGFASRFPFRPTPCALLLAAACASRRRRLAGTCILRRTGLGGGVLIARRRSGRSSRARPLDGRHTPRCGDGAGAVALLPRRALDRSRHGAADGGWHAIGDGDGRERHLAQRGQAVHRTGQARERQARERQVRERQVRRPDPLRSRPGGDRRRARIFFAIPVGTGGRGANRGRVQRGRRSGGGGGAEAPFFPASCGVWTTCGSTSANSRRTSAAVNC